MTIADYYHLLGLKDNSSVEEIKKAYRRMARKYHPDINPSPNAQDMFILVTEAYEFLISYYEKLKNNEDAFNQAVEDWKKYRQDISRKRARAYSQASYVRFKNSKLYKTTRIFDITTIIFSMVVSVLVILYTIMGYVFRLRHPIPGIDKPTVFAFIMLLSLGMVFFIVSMIYLKAFLETSGKHKKK